MVKLKFGVFFSATFCKSPLLQTQDSILIWKSNERIQPQQQSEETHKNEKSNTKSNNNNNNNDNNKQAAGGNGNGNGNGNGVIVLGVCLHCRGCVEAVVTSLIGFPGVGHVEASVKDNRVVVKGKTADPIRVAERVRQKSGKHVKLIFPQPQVVETVLKMNIDCEGCARDIKHCFRKMKGFQTVNVDMEKSHVMVKGAFDPKDLVAFITKRGRHAEIVNPINQNNKDENENGNRIGDNDHREYTRYEMPPGFGYVPPGFGYVYSDENPNGCSIMYEP